MFGGWVKKLNELSRAKNVTDTANSMVIATGKEGLVEEDEGKGWINGDGKRLYLEHMRQYADNVLLSYTFDTCMALLTTPVR